MRFNTLAEWLAWQETLHPQAIDLGLERPGRVLERLALERPFPVFTVAGTNGKGSTVALLDAILRAAGYRVGAYSSPHLFRYNERIRIDGTEVSDEALCEAFARVDEARGETSLTYFEFGTLAAFDLFSGARLDAAVIEVGMGGRLDAANLWDADVAVVTALDVDHAAWLGPDRATIAREKAGIFRRGRPALCSDPNPPVTLREAADEIGTPLYLPGEAYGWRADRDRWHWWGLGGRWEDLPLPALRGASQLDNASGVLAALELLKGRLPLTVAQIREGLRAVRLPGRFEVLPGPVTLIYDIGHNPHAARELARNLAALPLSGSTHLVLAMLADKEAEGVGRALKGDVDTWHLATLEGTRGRSAAALAEALRGAGIEGATLYRTVAEARGGALAAARPGDRVVVFGSFHTVAEALSEHQ